MLITGQPVPAELQRMYDQIAAAREAVGPNIDICVDMHGRYDAVTGAGCCKKSGTTEFVVAGRTDTGRKCGGL